MTAGYPADYHEYVFKDGKLLGRFDEMYRYSGDIPWHQDKTAYRVFSDIDITILRQHRYETILDVGCGLGFFTNRLFHELEGVESIVGTDISAAAIKKAKNMFPHIDFRAADIKEEKFLVGNEFDLVVCKDIMWYVFEKLDQVMKNLKLLIKPSGWLYISQSFPEKENYIGKEVIKSPLHLKEIFEKNFWITFSCIEWNSEYNNQPHIHLLAQSKEKL